MEALGTDGGWTAMARRLRRTVRRTRNRIRRSSVVLLYHRVAEGFADPWSMCVTPANFREQMAVLAARGVRSLAALGDDLGAGRVARTPVVTFDDGYADFHTTALPVLRAHGIPVTLFVTTGTLGRPDQELWWDELERIVLASPALPAELRLDVGGDVVEWSRAGEHPRALYHALHHRLGRLDGAARAERLGELRRWARVGRVCRPTHRPLSETALVDVAADPSVRIGAHTVSHSYLGALDAGEQQREIVEAKRALEAITGRTVDAFSYPHGDHEPATVELVRAAGFRIACGSACAPIVSDVDVLDLPRVEVPNFSGAAFARWLDEWVG